MRTERQVFDYAGILETDDSVRQMIDTIASLTIEDTGRFLMYDGTTQPW